MKCSPVPFFLCPLAPLVVFVLTAALALRTAEGEELPEAESRLQAVHAEPFPPSVLDDSFRYHRFGGLSEKAPHPTIAPTGGWYGYGFPAQTHRWGWFGAQHYYPRVIWHRGYYGDRSRWSYRRGY
jgi:hypothetical protein